MALLLKITVSIRIPANHSLEPIRPARPRYYRLRSNGLWEAQEPAKGPNHALLSHVNVPDHTARITPAVGLNSNAP